MAKEKKQISVVILVYEGDKNIIRCVNSVKRQNYDNIKITLLFYSKRAYDFYNIEGVEKNLVGYDNNQDNVLSCVLKQEKNNYFMLLNSDAVIEYNYISEYLVGAKSTGSKEKVVLADYQAWYPNGCIKMNNMLFSPIGKIINRKKMTNILDNNPKSYNDCFLWLDYYNQYVNEVVTKRVYIYENPMCDMKIYPKNISDYSIVEEWIKTLNKHSECIDVEMDNLLEDWLKSLISDNTIPDLALYLLDKVPNFYLLYMKIFEILIPEWIEKALSERDNVLYKKVQNFLNNVKENDVLYESILEILEYDDKEYKKLTSFTFAEYAYYKKIINVKRVDSGANISKKIKYEGPALEEFIVKKSANGKLGLKAFVRGIKAWGYYKFGKRVSR